MVELGVYDVRDGIITKIDLKTVRIGVDSAKTTSNTNHVIVYLDEHVLVVYRMLPHSVITKILKGQILIQRRGLHQLDQIFQVLLILSIGDPQHLIKESPLRNKVPLQIAVKDLDGSLPPEENETNDLKACWLCPRAN